MYKYMCAKEKVAKVIEVKVLDSLQILPFHTRTHKDTQGANGSSKYLMPLNIHPSLMGYFLG